MTNQFDDGMKPDLKLCHSFVYFEDKCFYVSTINRDSSAMTGGRYAETIVWEYDEATKKRGVILTQGEASEGSLHTHSKFCQLIVSTGSAE